MTLGPILIIAALALSLVSVIQSKGTSLVSWAVLCVSLALFLPSL